MEFTNSFTVDAPLDRVWEVVTDPHQVTPCVPGAQITETIDDSHFKGSVKVKLGAVQMTYRGEMEMHPDAATHSIALSGKGTDARGGGGASGKVSVTLEPVSDGTRVSIVSQVDVTGRVAQFGRGIMQDVSNRLIKEFARCLEEKLVSSATPAQGEASPAPETRRQPETPAPTSAASQSAGSPTATADLPAAPPPPPAPPSPPAPSAAPPPELSLSQLVMDITRARLAAGLRFLAGRIEPK